MRILNALRRRYKPMIPGVSASDIVDPDLEIRLRFYTFVSGSLTLAERVVLNALIRKNAPGTVFEIGTFDGRTTLNMVMNTSERTTVYTLDLPRENLDSAALSIDTLDRPFIDKPVSGAQFKGTQHEGRIVQLFGDSAEFDFSQFFRTVDLVFVDGSHSYEYVKNDSEVAMQLRSPRGVIVWHDYNRPDEWPGLARALDELYTKEARFSKLRHVLGTSFVILEP